MGLEGQRSKHRGRRGWRALALCGLAACAVTGEPEPQAGAPALAAPPGAERPGTPDGSFVLGPRAELGPGDLGQLPPDLPGGPALRADLEELLRDEPARAWLNRLSLVERLDGPELRGMFPGWSLYGVQYACRAKPECVGRASIPLSLGYTLAISPEGAARRLDHYGNREAFGQLLADVGAVVATAEDARLAWTIQQHLRPRFGYGGGGPERVDPGTWRLGISEREQMIASDAGSRTFVTVRSFYELRVDPASGRALAGRLRSERVGEPRVVARPEGD